MNGDDPGTDPPDESEPIDGSFGAIDASALREIRDLLVEMEPLVEAASLDDPLNPGTLAVDFADGIGDATSARFDVRWSLVGNYSFHYVDDADRHFRFDCHPKPDGPRRHFHSPPDASARPVDPSCITVSEVTLVARAVLRRWRYAYDAGTFDGINDAADPP